MPDSCVSAIIVTWNGAECIQRCLNSLVNNVYVNRIIVIDNNSSDRTVPILQSYADRIELVPLNTNLGFGKANNRGISIALKNDDFSHLLLLNQDAWLLDGCLEELLEVSSREPDYVILSPLHLSESQDALDSNFSICASPPNCVGWIDDMALQRKNQYIYETKMVNAAVWLLPKPGILQCGVFDPLFPHYGEDNEYCFRVVNLGFKVGIVTGASAVHARISGKPVERISKWQFIRQRSNKHYVIALVAIRRSSYNVVLIWFRRLIAIVLQMLVLLLKMEFEAALSYFLAFFLLVGNFPRIWRHTTQCKKIGAHFIIRE